MKKYTSEDLQQLDRFYRANLVNSLTGPKPAQLLSSIDDNGVHNLAVISSVTHLGSNPALLSYIQRPLGFGAGHTYHNLKGSGYMGLSHMTKQHLPMAHQTSAKYPKDISEWDVVGLDKTFHEGVEVPFVAGAPVHVLVSYLNEYYLKENDCIMVICAVEQIFVNKDCITNDGWLDLQTSKSLSVHGLDGYAEQQQADRYAYAQVDQPSKKIY